MMKSDVRIQIESWRPEQLLQRALDMGIALERVSRPDDHLLIVEAGSRDARRLLALCERFSVNARILERRGNSALMCLLRRRWTLLLGLMAMAALCCLALGRIWQIDICVAGNATPQDAAPAIETALDQLGIRPGISNRIDAARLSDELSAAMEGMSFVGVRVEGTRLLVEAAAEVAAPDAYDLDMPGNLYAARAGIVETVTAEAGTACVKPGDVVAQGQLLIRGEERAAPDALRHIAALGEVVIRSWFEGSAAGALVRERAEYTGRQSTSIRLCAPWFEVPLAEASSFESQSERIERIPIGGLYMPLCIERRQFREARIVQEPLDRAILATQLEALARADARAALDGAELTDYEIARDWTRIDEPAPGQLRVRAIYEIRTNTAVAREDIPKGG